MRRLLPILALVGAAAGLTVTHLWVRHGGDAVVTLTLRHVGLVAVIAVLTTANLALRWLRWHYLLRRTLLPTPTRTSLKLYFGTLPALATPLYVGESLRTALAARGNPRLGRNVFSVWIAERIADAAALAFFWALASADLGMLAAELLLLAAAIVLARRLLGSAVVTPEIIGALAVASVSAWIFPVVGLWAVVAGVGESVSVAASAEAFSAGTLLGGLSLLPAGFGVAGSTMIYQLQDAGVTEVTAISAIALFRAGTTGYALALGVLVFLVWRRDIASLAPRTLPQEHFEELADQYEDQIPAHIRDRLLLRKVAVMTGWLAREGIGSGARGLDIGCGQGWYAASMAGEGYEMFACDRSPGQVGHARASVQGRAVSLTVGTADGLPYATDTFDFAYGTNVIHHITDAEQRDRALRDIVRVLKPGGCFFLQEINVRNPLFALYMGYVFPLLRDIDDGTEVWLQPRHLPSVEGARWAEEKEYLTFLPDFVPEVVYKALRGIERRLEQSPARVYSAHFVASLMKDDAGPGHRSRSR